MKKPVERHEIIAWVNPDVWTDKKRAWRIINEIESSKSSVEEVWMKILEEMSKDE